MDDETLEPVSASNWDLIHLFLSHVIVGDFILDEEPDTELILDSCSEVNRRLDVLTRTEKMVIPIRYLPDSEIEDDRMTAKDEDVLDGVCSRSILDLKESFVCLGVHEVS